MRCEVVIPRSSGGDLVLPFEVADNASNADIQAAAGRAIGERYGGQGLVYRDVQYGVYLDTNPNSPGARGAGDHMLFIRGGSLVREAARTTRPAGTSPLTYHVPWEANRTLRATILNPDQIDSDPTQEGVQPLATLQDGITYTTNGQRGSLSPEEALSFVRSFEGKFNSDDAGRARLRLVADQNPQFDLGPDGNWRLSDIYSAAGKLVPGAMARPETGATGPNGGNGAGETGDLTAQQILSGTIDFSGLDENDAKCLAELRRLIMQLLQGGDPDILLAAIMNVQAKMSKNGLARAGVMVSRAMERINQQIRTNADRIATIQGSGHTGAQAGQDQGELTRLQTANVSLQGNLQMLSRVLQSFTEASQESSEMARNATEFHTRQSRYMAWS